METNTEKDQSTNDLIAGESRSLDREKSLIEVIQEENMNSILQWAGSTGLLENTDLKTNETGEITDKTTKLQPINANTEPPRPLAFVEEALNQTEGSSIRLLETLILGGGVLYALNRANGNTASNWIKNLIPKTSRFHLLGGVYERVITVFRTNTDKGLERIVAARITDDHVEILAEQQLPMNLEAASAKTRIDLQRELESLVEKVRSNSAGKRDLLLYDPQLKNELKTYEKLGKRNEELNLKQLRQKIKELNKTEFSELKQWINSPSKHKNKVHPIQEYLKRRQSQLRRTLSPHKSTLVSMLELSLALQANTTL